VILPWFLQFSHKCAVFFYHFLPDFVLSLVIRSTPCVYGTVHQLWQCWKIEDISQGMVASRPTVWRKGMREQLWGNRQENNQRGASIHWIGHNPKWTKNWAILKILNISQQQSHLTWKVTPSRLTFIRTVVILTQFNYTVITYSLLSNEQQN